jgi:low temperature requirement protein LtrA
VKHVRNFGIVALLALGVYALPGGGTAALLFRAVLFVIITLGIGLLGARYYRDHRMDVYTLGDRWRLIAYVALGVIVLALAGSPKLFDTGPGTLLWLVLIGGSGYALFRVWRHSREY